MSDMVERVARELFVMFRSVKPTGDAWQDYREDAKRIIKAMREPTEPMVEAAARKTTYEPDIEQAVEFISPYAAHTAWQASIDAALGEQP